LLSSAICQKSGFLRKLNAVFDYVLYARCTSSAIVCQAYRLLLSGQGIPQTVIGTIMDSTTSAIVGAKVVLM